LRESAGFALFVSEFCNDGCVLGGVEGGLLGLNVPKHPFRDPLWGFGLGRLHARAVLVRGVGHRGFECELEKRIFGSFLFFFFLFFSFPDSITTNRFMSFLLLALLALLALSALLGGQAGIAAVAVAGLIPVALLHEVEVLLLNLAVPLLGGDELGHHGMNELLAHLLVLHKLHVEHRVHPVGHHELHCGGHIVALPLLGSKPSGRDLGRGPNKDVPDIIKLASSILGANLLGAA
jgi:hypothetical protein